MHADIGTFVPVPDWAFALDLTAGELLVLGAVAAEYRHRAYALVGARTLARRLGRDRTSVRRWLAGLLDRGLVRDDGTEHRMRKLRLCRPPTGSGCPRGPREPGGQSVSEMGPLKKNHAGSDAGSWPAPRGNDDGTW